MSSFLFVSWLCVATSLKPMNDTMSSADGLSLTYNAESITITDNRYLINVQTQDAYDLKLSLHDSWGFSKDIVSSIALKMDGYTPYNTELLMVFSVDDFQYVSFSMHNIKYRIYSSIRTITNTQRVTEWISDTNTYPQRWNRISNNDEWTTLPSYRYQATGPFNFVITNQPTNNKSYFEFYHGTDASNTLISAFNSSFIAHKSIDIYLMGNTRGQTFAVSSFEITFNNMNQSKTVALHPVYYTPQTTYDSTFLVNEIDYASNTTPRNDLVSIHQKRSSNANVWLVAIILLLIASQVMLFIGFKSMKKRWQTDAFEEGAMQTASGITQQSQTASIRDAKPLKPETSGSSNISFMYVNSPQKIIKKKTASRSVIEVQMKEPMIETHHLSDLNDGSITSIDDYFDSDFNKASEYDCIMETICGTNCDVEIEQFVIESASPRGNVLIDDDDFEEVFIE
eukprot:202758_1